MSYRLSATDTEMMPWYQRPGNVFLAGILFWPVGLWMMWRFAYYWTRVEKTTATVVVLAMVALAIIVSIHH